MTASQTRRSGRILSFFTLLALLALLAAPGALAAPVGFVTSVDGLAEIQHSGAGGADWVPVALDSNVLMGDTIGTERNSFVKVLLVDDTTLFIDEETELVIDRLVVGDLATTERSVLRQLRGQVRAHVGEAFGGTTRLEIHTPTAIVGVKGSTMEVRVRGAVGSRETLVRNVEGEMFALGKDGRGTPIPIPRGLCSRILEGRDPEPAMPCPVDFEPVRDGPPSGVTQAALDPFILPGGVGAGGPGVVTAFQVPGAAPDVLANTAPGEATIDSVAAAALAGFSAPPLFEIPPIIITPIETPGGTD